MWCFVLMLVGQYCGTIEASLRHYWGVFSDLRALLITCNCYRSLGSSFEMPRGLPRGLRPGGSAEDPCLTCARIVHLGVCFGSPQPPPPGLAAGPALLLRKIHKSYPVGRKKASD